METALKAIFDSIKSEATTGRSGEQSFTFHLDGNGNSGPMTQSGQGLGKTINCTAWIETPDAIYKVTIQSDNKDHYEWSNVGRNQKLSFKIRTKTVGTTTVTATISANVTSTDGSGKVDYNY